MFLFEPFLLIFSPFQPEYKVADPICTFLFSLFVLGTTVTILRDVFRILMEGTPPGEDAELAKRFNCSLPTRMLTPV